MDPRQLIADLEAEAARLRLPIDEICARAKINRATWQRIKAGKTNSSIPTYGRLKDLLSELATTDAKPSRISGVRTLTTSSPSTPSRRAG